MGSQLDTTGMVIIGVVPDALLSGWTICWRLEPHLPSRTTKVRSFRETDDVELPGDLEEGLGVPSTVEEIPVRTSRYPRRHGVARPKRYLD